MYCLTDTLEAQVFGDARKGGKVQLGAHRSSAVHILSAAKGREGWPAAITQQSDTSAGEAANLADRSYQCCAGHDAGRRAAHPGRLSEVGLAGLCRGGPGNRSWPNEVLF